MMRYVSAADANRHFSKLLRAVAGGERVVITSRGKPVAELCPPREDFPDRAAAREALLAALRERPILNLPRATRDEMYE